MPTSTPQITAAFGEPIKQYAGQVQVLRAVKVECPGRHFPGLSANEQKLDYWVTAMEFRDRYVFQRHNKAWGAAHTGPGIRFVSDSDAIDDPDHKGFWTTLSLWNRWRDQTYQSDREAEKQYLDELTAAPAARAPAAEQQAPAGAPIKEHFTLHSTGTAFHRAHSRSSLNLISPEYACIMQADFVYYGVTFVLKKHPHFHNFTLFTVHSVWAGGPHSFPLPSE